MARDSREAPPGPRETSDAPSTIWYYDDRNKYHEQDGCPAFDPDNPQHQGVPFGTIVADPDTVHALRGGTGERTDHLRRLHPRASGREPVAGTCCRGVGYERGQPIWTTGELVTLKAGLNDNRGRDGFVDDDLMLAGRQRV